jgi:hypothetical protein
MFWISSKEEYPEIARKAVVILMQFSAPYLHHLQSRTAKKGKILLPTKMK